VTVFLPTDFLDGKDWLWWTARYAVWATRLRAWKWNCGDGPKTLLKRRRTEGSGDGDSRAAKRMPNAERLKLLDGLPHLKFPGPAHRRPAASR
jgi:hypothetical protein